MAMRNKDHDLDLYHEVISRNVCVCIACGRIIGPGDRKYALYKGREPLCVDCYEDKRDGVENDYDDPELLTTRLKHNLSFRKVVGNVTSAVVAGRLMYVALDRAIRSKRIIMLDMMGCNVDAMCPRFMDLSFGKIMDKYGADIFDDRLSLMNVRSWVADKISKYITEYKEDRK